VLGSATRNIVIGGIADDGTILSLLEVAAGTAGGGLNPGTADPIDWARDGDGLITTNLSQNQHYYADIPECQDTAKFGLDVESGFTGLRSQDDWGTIVFNFRNTDGFATGAINVLNDEQIDSNQQGNLDPATPGIAVDAGEDVTLFENQVYMPIFFMGNNVHDDPLSMDIDYDDGTVITIDPEDFEPTDIDHIYFDDDTYVVTTSLTVTYGDGTSVGNTDTATVTVIPIYDEVTFSPPLSENPYNVGRTIPIKFMVIEDGQSISDLSPEIWLSFEGADPDPQPAKENNSDNNIATFDEEQNRYQYQMATSELPPDVPISIIIVLPDSEEIEEQHQTIVTLSAP
jgi:hypothetical protein